MTVSVTEAQAAAQTRAEVNRTLLEAEVYRLRLLLQRRVLWLRRQWRDDPLQNCQGLVISDAQADWLLAGEDRQAEARFYRDDPQAAAISSAIADRDQELAEHTRGGVAMESPPPLELLVHLFGLAAFERNVLLLCLAPELDPAFERLYAYVQDDVSRKYATPHLALTLFNGKKEDWPAARDSFLPESPLRRFRLVTLEPGPLSATIPGARPLRLDERIADYLQGVHRMDERVADLLRPVPPALLAPGHGDLVDRLVRAFESGVQRGRCPILNLTGPVGAGKETVARALSDRLGLALWRIQLSRLPAQGPGQEEMLRLLERESALLQLAYYVDLGKVDSDDKAAMESAREVIEHVGSFLIVGSRTRWRTQRATVTMPVSKPAADAQRDLWRQALAGGAGSLDGHIEAVVQQFDFGPQAIAEAVATGKSWAWLRAPLDGADPTADDLWQACREQSGWHLDELAQRITPCYTWEDIVLPEDVFRQLQELAAQVAHRPVVYDAWGFGRKLSRGRGISALFSGPSGTGKTMAAEILANHLKLDLYRIDLAGVVSKYIGETEKNLKKVFDAAEQSGAILFFDEADALFGKRTEVKDSHDRYANIEVNYLLQRMEDYRGLAILASNRRAALDRAFLRRLRFLVDFPFPDANIRRRIWQKAFPTRAPVDELDYASLARLEISGGNIRNIAVNAAFLSAEAGSPIGMSPIMHAARREYTKIDKMMTEAEFRSYRRQTES